MEAIERDLLLQIADLHGVPEGAYNIRANGGSLGRNTTANIDIVTKTDGKSGIDIFIKAGTKNESVHIPVVISKAGLQEVVYNDFHIGADCDVVIVAGCGIHNGGDEDSDHSGIHRFVLDKNARVKYVEKHYGDGDGNGKRIMNPTTECELGENSYMEMETAQIKGVDSTSRTTKAKLDKGATLIVREKLMTHGDQVAETYFEVDMDGEDCSAHLVSRSVSKDRSKQVFTSVMNGNARCNGRSECDAIIMDEASVGAVPQVFANHIDASMVHEAAIGKLAGDQLIKLMTLGLTEQEAEEQIINGFLK